MKSKVDKLDCDKLVADSVDISKLSDVVKNDVVKKTEYDKLVKKVNAIQSNDASNLVEKADCNTKINEIEKKITDHNHSSNYITTQKFNRLTSANFATRLTQANLARMNDIAALVKKGRSWW